MLELNKVHHGKCLDLFKELPDESIDCVITSPPYWQLRDYKWDGQWGLEPTFQLYLENLWSMMDEVWRVLKPSGTAWVNLGDTYNGNKTGNNDPKLKDGIKEESLVRKQKGEEPDKCLLLIPHRFAIGCIDRGWVMRNDIIWAKRNGMPESVTDRFSKKHEYFFFMAKQEKYYFDLDGIRDRMVTQENRPHGVVRNRLYDYDSKFNRMNESKTKVPQEDAEMFGSPRARQHRQPKFGGAKGDGQDPDGIYSGNEWKPREDGKNPGDVSDFWDIPTQPSSDEHYAAYNDKLIGKPIVAGCPPGGIILDPFTGTATTGCRAIELGRKFIGFEGSDKFVKIGEKNLKPYRQQSQLF